MTKTATLVSVSRADDNSYQALADISTIIADQDAVVIGGHMVQRLLLAYPPREPCRGGRSMRTPASPNWWPRADTCTMPSTHADTRQHQKAGIVTSEGCRIVPSS